MKLFPVLQTHGDTAIKHLEDSLKSTLADATVDEKEQFAQEQANAAVALLRLQPQADIWHLLRHQPDPRLRSYLIHRLQQLNVPADVVAGRLLSEKDVTIRRALILSLGEFHEDQLTESVRRNIVAKIEGWYQSETDPGIHGAVRWLFRQWNLDETITRLDAKLRQETITSREPPADDQRWWYINGQGQTMVVIRGPVEFQMGSPETEADRDSVETIHPVEIPRSFAIAAHEVTKEQFLWLFRDFGHSQMHRYPEDDCPIGGVVWYEAAMYCNRLSEEEGIPESQWCYDVSNDSYRLAPDYLQRTGYRLPTEAEWEYACRAGTVTSRYYGDTEELLGEYGWFFANAAERTWPTGTLKPNDYGLFDMYGNNYEWCQDRYAAYPSNRRMDREDQEIDVRENDSRVLRGGSFNYNARYLRSAYRNGAPAHEPLRPIMVFVWRGLTPDSPYSLTTSPP